MTLFMRNQWKAINADKILSENEVHDLIKAVEKYLERPGSEPVRQVVEDYKSFLNYVRDGAAKGIFPAMWPQYLMSAKTGFLRYQSYRDILPKGAPVPAAVPPPTTAKPAPRPPFPDCCKREWERLRKVLKLSAAIDVVAITSDAFTIGSAGAKAKLTGKLRDPNAILTALQIKDTAIDSLLPVAAKQAGEHAQLHDDDDAYLQAWWTKLSDSLWKYVK